METVTSQPQITKGGEFLIKTTTASDIFIAEDFNEEARMMKNSLAEFIEKEIEPILDKIDAQEDPELNPRLLEKTGELGFLGLGVPEEYGGYEIPFNNTLFFVEELSKSHSFSAVVGVQTSIGIAPILLYGNEAQKAKYLPKLVTGEWKTCYCLTEPDAGSDANSGKTKAVPTEDGQHYMLNGQKMWITNSGFSNIFIVFAKIEDDKKLSAFIVEKEFGGVTLGEEEKKMGIKGSSTRQVFFNDVKVPAENLLGEREQGFKIAVNVLNTGRIKLGTGTIGVGKKTINFAVQYANERKQFGKPISSYGAIKQKLARMAARTYAVESTAYRVGHNIDLQYDDLIAAGVPVNEAKYKCVEEYGIECAIIKVLGSEVQDFVVDEGVQIFGGMGFSADAPMDRLYRDARIARIFEGTNEINRMLMIDMLLKKAMKGQLDLMGPAQQVAKELTSIPSFGEDEDNGLFWAEKKVLANLKKVIFMVAGSALQKLMASIKDEQEIMMNVADMLMHVLSFESALLRTEKLIQNFGEEKYAAHIDMTRIIMHEATETVQKAGKEAIYAFAEGDEQRLLLMGLKRFTKVEPLNLKEVGRRVADELINANKYSFES
ncbi:MAG: acyl-CoA dehydrogenase family protein [Bacteroidota bacterium]